MEGGQKKVSEAGVRIAERSEYERSGKAERMRGYGNCVILDQLLLAFINHRMNQNDMLHRMTFKKIQQRFTGLQKCAIYIEIKQSEQNQMFGLLDAFFINYALLEIVLLKETTYKFLMSNISGLRIEMSIKNSKILLNLYL